MEKWELIFTISSSLGAFFVPFTYGVRKLITWWVYSGVNSDEGKAIAKEALIKSIIGFVVFGLWMALTFAILNLEPEVVSELIPRNEKPITDPIGGYYVKDMVIGGASYSGYYNTETEKPEGQGIMKYSDGGIYDGNWENGIRQGEGIMKYNNGDIYDGDWEDGKKCGKGTYTWQDGRKYDGDYKDDMREGEGTFSGWTGFEEKYGYGWKGTYKGTNKEDKFEGQGNFYFDNGGEFGGIFFDNGLWTGKYKKDGNTYNVVDGEILF